MLQNNFDNIKNEWDSRLKIFALSYVRSLSVAEDLVQDTFLKLLESKADISKYPNIGSLLYTILKNNCLDYLKHKLVEKKHHDSVMDDYNYLLSNKYALEDDSIKIITKNEVNKALRNAIEKLPDKTREIFILNKLQDFKYKEIADQLNISEKTVEYHISKAFAFLREQMGEYYILALIFYL